jgi:hypothetical protein
MNLAKGSNRTFPKRKRATGKNGVKIILLTATGDIKETPIREHKAQKR